MPDQLPLAAPAPHDWNFGYLTGKTIRIKCCRVRHDEKPRRHEPECLCALIGKTFVAGEFNCHLVNGRRGCYKIEHEGKTYWVMPPDECDVVQDVAA